ncbi:MAG: bacillithiol biosynthesis BshC [Candidatus Latescibacteria bacterium]|nr:bacillithiol biosynthesis BshC [Candidatus Latescibacterota bacterium]NIM20934.1 bacillithiol biosynthesis BshC [Candidatus Latescibacterota bacterium]NIM65069.1 bacillithiol biosynthesis BshC [Candidatus Latescibacterota bacterium]NIO01584.1 bacillithiol biosynthesis BshC [Candidatus Latescibacterota bacterium]NIO28101.1 bacillithiol biosynthesis BshC [Candidatus Latescibacterota bacterium]
MHTSILHTIPVADFSSENKLFLDFVENPSDGLGGLLQGFSGNAAFWQDFLGAGAYGQKRAGSEWMRILDDVIELGKRAGTAPAVLEKLEQAKHDGVLFVVTGQQPAILGGPLITLYKAFSAVVLSNWLEKLLSRTVIPLFWVGSDDTDFQEIRTLSTLSEDLSPLSTGIPADAHESTAPVGDIAIDSVARTWDSIARRLDAFPKGGFVRECVSKALSAARDNGEASAAVLASLTGGQIAFADGRSVHIRECVGSLFSDYLEREESVKRVVIERGSRLESKGYHAQLSVGEDSGIFLMEGGKRRTVKREQLPLLREVIRQSVGRCSPGVILRNLVQDSVFHPAAVILGPAEIAYRAQIADLYEEFEIPRPVVVPRLAATYIPAPLKEIVEGETRDRINMLFQEPARFAAAIYEDAVPTEIEQAVSRFIKEVGGAVDVFQRTVNEAIHEKLRARLAGRLSELRKRVDQIREVEREAGKAAALERHPYLANVGSVVKPRGKPQERILSSLTPYLFSGETAAGIVRAAAEHYIHELMDGNPSHIVYCG